MIELEHEINIPTPSADCCQGCSEREQKLQDENQALRDQVELLEKSLATTNERYNKLLNDCNGFLED